MSLDEQERPENEHSAQGQVCDPTLHERRDRFKSICACRRRTLEWLIGRSTLEKFLLAVITIMATTVIVMLATKDFSSSTEPINRICTTPACLKEAGKLLELVNSDRNLCEDFYDFTCHKFMEVAEDDDKIGLKAFQKQQLIDIYREDIDSEDHKMVKIAKRVFQACLDEVQIERDELKTIKKAIKSAGGWPAVDGSQWHDNKFDWVQSTYKLRDLGYPFSTFLKLSLDVDPDDNDKFIFQVSTVAYDYDYGLYQSNEINEMAKVVEIFGASDRKHNILADMENSFNFWKLLKENEHPPHIGHSFSKFTVEQYQSNFNSFNWLEFINKIAGPAAVIKSTDHVLFPPPENMTKWLDIISRTSKKIQANYIMWQVVEGVTHLLHRELRNFTEIGSKAPTRKDFCFSQTEQRFDPSPIRLLFDQRYVSAIKRKQMRELIENMKLAFVDMLNEFEWMEKEDKQRTIKKINNVTLVIARPENYFDENIFDELDVDVVETKKGTFLTQISQATKNYVSSKYKQVTIPRSESFLGKDYINNYEVEYVIDENVIFVPGVAVQRYFHEQKPDYLNYGMMGTLVGNSLAVILDEPANNEWSNKTKENFLKSIRCLKQQIYSHAKQSKKVFLPVYTLADTPITLMTVIYTKQLVAERLSHAAYNQLHSKIGQEPALPALTYTQQQLFWISAMTTLCPRGVAAELDYNATAEKAFFCISNDNNFAKDFHCPLESRMNPSHKCSVL